MIEQYLSNTNKIATVLILLKILELNKALIHLLKIIMCTLCLIISCLRPPCVCTCTHKASIHVKNLQLKYYITLD